MYLYKRLYTKNWDHTPEESRIQVTVVKNNEDDFNFDYKYAIIIGFAEGYKTFDRLDDVDSPFDFRALYKWLTDDYIYYYKP